jgi:hypothetical protein
MSAFMSKWLAKTPVGGWGGGDNFSGPQGAQKRLRLEGFKESAHVFFTRELKIPEKKPASRPTAEANLALDQREDLSNAYAKYRRRRWQGRRRREASLWI